MSYLLKSETEAYEKSHGKLDGEQIEKPSRKIGFIADEVQEIVPELVKVMHDGTKALAYHNITALNVEAIKEQQKIIKSMKQEIIDLREQLEAVSANEIINIDDVELSNNTILHQNKPNPFTETTVIEYEIDEANFTSASIMIFDMNGTLLKTYAVSSGKNELVINGREFKAGMYIYTLIVSGQEIDTKHMILSK